MDAVALIGSCVFLFFGCKEIHRCWAMDYIFKIPSRNLEGTFREIEEEFHPAKFLFLKEISTSFPSAVRCVWCSGLDWKSVQAPSFACGAGNSRLFRRLDCPR